VLVLICARRIEDDDEEEAEDECQSSRLMKFLTMPAATSPLVI
jgi:hypothetical protein